MRPLNFIVPSPTFCSSSPQWLSDRGCKICLGTLHPAGAWLPPHPPVPELEPAVAGARALPVARAADCPNRAWVSLDAWGRELGPGFGGRRLSGGPTGDWSRGEPRKGGTSHGGIPGAFPKLGSPSFPFSGGGAFLANVSVSPAACSAFSAISSPPLCPAVLQGAPRQLQARAYPGPLPWCGTEPGNSQRALGGATRGSLGPCGIVPRVSAFESAVVARGGSAGSGTLSSSLVAPIRPQEVPGRS